MMKKRLSIFFVAFLIGLSLQAQSSNEDLRMEMDQMMLQMQEMMKGFGDWIGDAPILMDTMIVREFHFPADDLNSMMFQFSPDSLMKSDLFRGMEDMMHQWSNQDMSGMEEFFKDLEKLMPIQPEYNQQEQDPSEKNKEQKRKEEPLRSDLRLLFQR